METIAISNQKGGCGKTTTAINTAAAFAMLGKRVLLIDFDPQAHATIGLGYDPETLKKTVYEAMTDYRVKLQDVIVTTNMNMLDLAPSSVLLGSVEFELSSVSGKELILGELLGTIEDNYELCVIDCAPPLSLLMLNALVASQDVVIPIQVHYYALEGLKRLLETIHILRERFHPCTVKALGLLLTLVESRTLLAKQIQQQVRDYFGDLVFNAVIHRTVRLAEAPSAGESIFTYAPKSRAALEHLALAEEILSRLKNPPNQCCGT